MAYRVFEANWWADKANTKPIDGPRRKRIVRIVDSEQEARELCRQHNTDSLGNRVERPYGRAYEYEEL